MNILIVYLVPLAALLEIVNVSLTKVFLSLLYHCCYLA